MLRWPETVNPRKAKTTGAATAAAEMEGSARSCSAPRRPVEAAAGPQTCRDARAWRRARNAAGTHRPHRACSSPGVEEVAAATAWTPPPPPVATAAAQTTLVAPAQGTPTQTPAAEEDHAP